MKKILIAGGSGYLGQILVPLLSQKYEIYFTYNSQFIKFPDEIKARGFKVNFVNGANLSQCLDQIGKLDVVIYCAAISKPKVAEENPHTAMKVNVPSKIISSLFERSWSTFFIQISSDTVYDGQRGNYNEESICKPVNAYGVSKLAAEDYVKENVENYAILRSSVIIGPKTVVHSESPFLKFVVDSLKSGKITEFFSDEYRCYTYSDDIYKVIDKLIENNDQRKYKIVLNLGSTERLNRVEIAQKIGSFLRLDTSLISPVSSTIIDRGYKSPLDISMDSTRLIEELGLCLTNLESILKLIYI